jgi:hypothetical protein
VPNAIFAKGREAWANGDVDWLLDDIKAALVDLDGLTVNTGTMQFLSQITAVSGAVVSTAALSGKTSINGVLDAADTLFPAVSGDQVEALIIYKDTGVAATSPLLIYFDTAAGGAGITLVPNGGDITAVYNSAGIATL